MVLPSIYSQQHTTNLTYLSQNSILWNTKPLLSTTIEWFWTERTQCDADDSARNLFVEQWLAKFPLWPVFIKLSQDRGI